MIFVVISVFIANPFQSEPNAAATPDYARVMFLHGLLIGMVGLGALLTCQVLALRSLHIRLWIAGGGVAATVLATVGGIWDRSIPGSEVPMWVQILGFFALDEILLLLVVGIIGERRRGLAIARTLPFLAGSRCLCLDARGRGHGPPDGLDHGVRSAVPSAHRRLHALRVGGRLYRRVAWVALA